jgi:hypothetical protein
MRAGNQSASEGASGAVIGGLGHDLRRDGQSTTGVLGVSRGQPVSGGSGER